MSKDEEMKRVRGILARIDKETFEGRTQNLSGAMIFVEMDRLFSVQPISKNIESFRKEALTDFINGCFRSCIFSCACAVEQTFKEELIISSDDPEETLWEFEIKKPSFKRIIEKARSNEKLKKIVNRADNLRKLRNEIAVHPMQIPSFPEPKTKDKIILTNKTMIRSTRKILTFLDSEFAEAIKNVETGNGDQKITVREILQDPTTPSIEMMWEGLQKAVLRNLAFTALRDAWDIMKELYGKKEEIK